MKIQTVLLMGAMTLICSCNRTHAFLAQAQTGQPIVRAIEEYRKQTGNYPASLTNLVPTFLAKIPDTVDKSRHKFSGWEYRPITNDVRPSYILRYYMGRGGVEYKPPNWIGNDEGDQTIILKNE